MTSLQFPLVLGMVILVNSGGHYVWLLNITIFKISLFKVAAMLLVLLGFHGYTEGYPPTTEAMLNMEICRMDFLQLLDSAICMIYFDKLNVIHTERSNMHIIIVGSMQEECTRLLS